MKKYITVILAILVVFSLCGCRGNAKDANTASDDYEYQPTYYTSELDYIQGGSGDSGEYAYEDGDNEETASSGEESQNTADTSSEEQTSDSGTSEPV